MRAMNEQFGKTGKGYRDNLDIRLTAEKVAGGSFEEFFDRYVAAAGADHHHQFDLPVDGIGADHQRLGRPAERFR